MIRPTPEIRLPLEGLPEWCVRGWRTEDARSLTLHANNPAVARNLRDSFPHPYLEEHAREWILAGRAADPPTHLAIAHLDDAVGGIGVHPQQDIFRYSRLRAE
ncbi:MAG: hypothetical protein HZB25_13065 [Candidatus Eisenbacteria bacterium]|nr:hypothetical protein [Candidatus Eisenbacteria bacterium]